MTLCQQFFLSLTHEDFPVAFFLSCMTLCQQFSILFTMFVLFSSEKVWNVCSVYVLFLMLSVKELRTFVAELVNPFVNIWWSHYWQYLHDIPSHLLGYSNKCENPKAGIGLKTCFSLYYKIKTYKVTRYLVFYKHNYKH